MKKKVNESFLLFGQLLSLIRAELKKNNIQVPVTEPAKLAKMIRDDLLNSNKSLENDKKKLGEEAIKKFQKESDKWISKLKTNNTTTKKPSKEKTKKKSKKSSKNN